MNKTWTCKIDRHKTEQKDEYFDEHNITEHKNGHIDEQIARQFDGQIGGHNVRHICT